MEILNEVKTIDINKFIDFSQPYSFESGVIVKYSKEDLFIKVGNDYIKLDRDTFYLDDFIRKVTKGFSETTGKTSIVSTGYSHGSSYNSENGFGGAYCYGYGASSGYMATSSNSSSSSYTNTSTEEHSLATTELKAYTNTVILFPELYIKDPVKNIFAQFDAFTKIPDLVMEQFKDKDEANNANKKAVLKTTIKYMENNGLDKLNIYDVISNLLVSIREKEHKIKEERARKANEEKRLLAEERARKANEELKQIIEEEKKRYEEYKKKTSFKKKTYYCYYYLYCVLYTSYWWSYVRTC